MGQIVVEGTGRAERGEEVNGGLPPKPVIHVCVLLLAGATAVAVSALDGDNAEDTTFGLRAGAARRVAARFNHPLCLLHLRRLLCVEHVYHIHCLGRSWVGEGKSKCVLLGAAFPWWRLQLGG